MIGRSATQCNQKARLAAAAADDIFSTSTDFSRHLRTWKLRRIKCHKKTGAVRTPAQIKNQCVEVGRGKKRQVENKKILDEERTASISTMRVVVKVKGGVCSKEGVCVWGGGGGYFTLGKKGLSNYKIVNDNMTIKRRIKLSHLGDLSKLGNVCPSLKNRPILCPFLGGRVDSFYILYAIKRTRPMAE